MGRRSSRAVPGAPGAPAFDTVGMTILPGHPLPEWAMELPEDRGWAQPLPVDEAAPAAAADGAVDPHVAPDPTVAGAAQAAAGVSAPADHEYALVGAAVGAGAVTAGMGAVAAQPDLPSPFGAGYTAAGISPAAGTAGTGTPAGSGLPAAGYPPPGAGPASPGAPFPPMGTGFPSAVASAFPVAPPAPRAPEAPPFGSAAGGRTAAPDGGPPSMTAAPASHAVDDRGHTADPATTAPWSSSEGATTGTATLEAPQAASSAAAPSQPGAPAAPATPSQGWAAPDRPELSPEHVALLTWWADMIAKGQFPAPAGAAGAAPPPPREAARRRRGRSRHAEQGQVAASGTPALPAAPAEPAEPRTETAAGKPDNGSGRRTALVALSLGGIAAVGLAVAFGPVLVSSFTEEPAPVPTTNLTMPTAVGDLVAVSSPDVSDQLLPLLGLGLRPAGVTTTAGYATDPASPVVLAGLATTTPADADATGQISQWAQRMGATVGEPVAGSAGTGGVTCAEVSAIPDGLPGSFCVWSGSDRRGQSYVVGATPDGALEQTAQLREGVIAAP